MMAAPDPSTEDVARRILRLLTHNVTPPNATHMSHSPGPGWLGLEPMTKVVNHQLMLELDEGASRVMVAAGSPARRSGILSGDYVVSIDGRTLAEFEAAPPPAGATAVVRLFREGTGYLLFDPTLRERPTEKAAKLAIESIPCGEIVAGRGSRFKWLSRITGDPRFSPTAKAIATRLVVYYLDRHGVAWPAHETLAKELGRSTSQVKRAIRELNRAGLLEIGSGKLRGRSNRYRLTWPSSLGSNIVRANFGGV